ncbi:MAG: U32 family peptidase [Erysipelotrichaceae bacterium]|jgi:putative protease|nr:U32 family peptidase [Erysipelotrichaceae bacterium]
MELLLTLRKIDMLEKVLPLVDGIICGKYFCSAYRFSKEELVQIRKYCYSLGKKFYIVMDNFISEDEKMLMYEYLDFIDTLNVDGIFFHDLGVFDAVRSYSLRSRLIYDGKSVMCNSLDAAFMLDQGIDSVMISRELTLEEVKEIAVNHPGKIDMQIFGHLRMSYSRRRFLSNYFRQIRKEYDYFDKETLSLIEEKREYKMPIMEDEGGTFIYTDYIFTMFDELCELRPYLKRGIIDTLFVEDANKIAQVCRDYRRINESNRDFIRESFYHNYPDHYSSGYLYQKTNITKDEQN